MSKTLSSNRGLHSHVKSIHLNENLFQCDKCDKSFYQKRNLNRHVTLLHESYSEKLMTKCDICNMTVKKNSLWSHMENHTEKTRSIQNVEIDKSLQDELVVTDVKT